MGSPEKKSTLFFFASSINGLSCLFVDVHKIIWLTFLLNFNQSIHLKSNLSNLKDKVELLEIEFLKNENTFDEKDWEELYKISEETFVKENESLKNTAAGAGLTDND